MAAAARWLAGWLIFTLAATGATLVRSPYLQNIQSDRASILWTTREAGSGSVTFTDGRTTRTVAAAARLFLPAETKLPDAFYQYEANLTGLTTGTSYEYKVLVDGAELKPESAGGSTLGFRTEGPGAFSFLVFGDSGSGSPQQLQLAGMMAAEPGIALAVHTGDLAYNDGSYSDFESHYFAPYAGLMHRVPFFPTPGNHEYVTGRAAPYLAVHSLPDSGTPAEDKGRYYSYDWGDVHFVSLDSNLLPDAAAVDRMLAWFEGDLKATAKPWKIVYFHHTPYPSGYHLDDPICALARDLINPVAERNGVQLVLNGHEHSLQRTFPLSGGIPTGPGTGTTYINSSGGGGWLEDIGRLPVTAVSLHVYNYLRADVESRRIIIRAFGLDGAQVDSVAITARPAVRRPRRAN